MGCAGTRVVAVTDLAIGDPARRDRQVPVVLDGITDTGTGNIIGPADAAARLDRTRIVFVGEEHTNPGSHEAQRQLIAALIARGRQVLVGLEMYPYTTQDALDDWVAGLVDEPAFLRASHWYKHWGYSWDLYRDIFLLAQEQRVLMFAVNTPRDVVAAVRKKGLANLTADEAAHIPPIVDTKSTDHRRLFRAFFEEGDKIHSGLSVDAWENMFQAQCTWDATMAKNAVESLKAHGGENAIMVVLIGGGHVAYGMGIQRQAALWFDGVTTTVATVPVASNEAPTRVRASYADFLWGVPARDEPARPTLAAVGVSVRDDAKTPHPVLTSVEGKSAAELGGARTGDQILSLDGAPVPDKEGFLLLLNDRHWGDVVHVDVQRQGQRLTLSVPLRRLSPPGP